ncbi:MAG: D-alanine--D-alanine ligase [Treponema sp.]|jgi:D-alanine-D-alanine ligase|nr:D-alanine--D-alanine ligase [Treponema sp.]
MGKKIRVGILAGGRSAEHEVSLQSAKNVIDALDRDRFEPVLIGIDKSGRWLLLDPGNFLLNADDPRRISLHPSGNPAALLPHKAGIASETGAPAAVDVIFPILHGPYGEDGTVQGLLKTVNIPFVGPSVLGSAAGMDKDVMKRLLRDAGIPIGKFLVFSSHEEVPSFTEAAGVLGSPVFIKPANMGSSVGISRVCNGEEYRSALAEAFRYDTKIVMEEYIRGRELECAVLGNRTPLASLPGEVKPARGFYSYEAKYLDEKGAVLEIPARLPEETVREIQALAVKTFKVLCCEGLSRVDFFLREDGTDGGSPPDGRPRLFVNEINTMPGFTRISMYPKLWEASGVSYTELISRLIDLAMERFESEQSLTTSVAP